MSCTSARRVFRLRNPGAANKNFQKRTEAWKEKVVLERGNLRQRWVNTLSGEKVLAGVMILEKSEGKIQEWPEIANSFT